MIPRYGEWEQRFGPPGLSVVGVHTPETESEHDLRRLEQFVKDNKIRWRVVLDPDYAVWNRYQVEAWPTIVLIDRHGVIRATFVGDDRSAAIELALGELLREK